MVDSDEKKPAAQAQPMGALIGGRYKAIRKLGAGQMGEVVEAEDVLLRKPVAVKVIREQYARDPGFADRLRLEAQAVAAVAARTPHVVSALDLGQTPDGRAYVVFELLAGCTLREELRARKHLPPAEAIALMQQLLDGLAAAHEAGLVHRDIKHENVYLCAARAGGERVLKILDFGIAKVIDPSAAGAPMPLALPTAKGMIVGTPRFVAPEQILGQPIDPRADIYSAGIVLYMLLAGRDPFHHHRETFDVLAAQVKEAPKPPSALAAQPIPEALDRIVLRALAKDPAERFPDAMAFAAALAQVESSSAPQRWPRTERVNLQAFQAQPSSAAGAKTTRLPSAVALVDDETVATLQIAPPPTTARPVLMTPPPVPQWVLECRQPAAPLGWSRRRSRVQIAALAFLAALVVLELAVVVVYWFRR